MHFRKPYDFFQSMDVQETNFSFAQFNRIRNHFFGCRIKGLDGIPALGLWDLIVTVLLGNMYQNNQERRDPCTNQLEVRAASHKSPTRKKIHAKIDDLDNVDFIHSNVHSSRKEALLYVFEDDEAVIKMIIKGRSRTMRHVSRNHGIALDWLFDRINWDPKNPNQIH